MYIFFLVCNVLHFYQEFCMYQSEMSPKAHVLLWISPAWPLGTRDCKQWAMEVFRSLDTALDPSVALTPSCCSVLHPSCEVRSSAPSMSHTWCAASPQAQNLWGQPTGDRDFHNHKGKYTFSIMNQLSQTFCYSKGMLTNRLSKSLFNYLSFSCYN